jgi:hypothetical protein
MRKSLSLLLLICNAWPLASFGAACCGGGFAAPSLIAGDDRAQFTASYGYSAIHDDVGADSFWRKRDSRETGETIKLEAAHIFRDRWQAGASLPLVRRARAGDSSAGLGDLAATLGYEFLPDWDYNPWRPKGLAFLQLTLPTGRSANEANTTYQLDSRGRGFWALGLGTLLTKVYDPLDLWLSFDAHRSFPKTFATQGGAAKLSPGFGGNAGGGAGVSFGDLRAGASLTWSYEEPVRASGAVASRGSPQRYATAALSLSYLLPQNWAVTLAYNDQTRFGHPANTSLGRGGTFFLQKRWLR